MTTQQEQNLSTTGNVTLEYLTKEIKQWVNM